MSSLVTSIVVGPFTFTDCSYDTEADIAYLSIGDPKPAVSWESPEGHLVRLDPEADELVGITLLGLKQLIEAGAPITVTLPEHVLAALGGQLGAAKNGPAALPAEELAALCS